MVLKSKSPHPTEVRWGPFSQPVSCPYMTCRASAGGDHVAHIGGPRWGQKYQMLRDGGSYSCPPQNAADFGRAQPSAQRSKNQHGFGIGPRRRRWGSGAEEGHGHLPLTPGWRDSPFRSAAALPASHDHTPGRSRRRASAEELGRRRSVAGRPRSASSRSGAGHGNQSESLSGHNSWRE